MRNFLSSLAAAAFIVSLGASSALADAGGNMKGHGNGAMMGSMAKTTCPKGSVYVHGYMKKDKTMVKGYCRKKGMSK